MQNCITQKNALFEISPKILNNKPDKFLKPVGFNLFKL